jgi:hypothetical protein
MKRAEQAGNARKAFLVLISIVLTLIYSLSAFSLPDGATIVALGNTTKTVGNGQLVNYSGSSVSAPDVSGGYIFTINVTGKTQNMRWKAFVGNASGKLTLDDASGSTIYDWTLTATSGRLFTTRSASNVNWSGIGCATTNITEHENRYLNLTSRDDNITKTFSGSTGKSITIGTVSLAAGQCKMTNLFVNSTTPSTEDTFEEQVLYDLNGTAYTPNDNFPGNVVYGQNLENQKYGYQNTSRYDFQILMPERGNPGWTSSTAYYFYVELA